MNSKRKNSDAKINILQQFQNELIFNTLKENKKEFQLLIRLYLKLKKKHYFYEK